MLCRAGKEGNQGQAPVRAWRGAEVRRFSAIHRRIRGEASSTLVRAWLERLGGGEHALAHARPGHGTPPPRRRLLSAITKHRGRGALTLGLGHADGRPSSGALLQEDAEHGYGYDCQDHLPHGLRLHTPVLAGTCCTGGGVLCRVSLVGFSFDSIVSTGF